MKTFFFILLILFIEFRVKNESIMFSKKKYAKIQFLQEKCFFKLNFKIWPAIFSRICNLLLDCLGFIRALSWLCKDLFDSFFYLLNRGIKNMRDNDRSSISLYLLFIWLVERDDSCALKIFLHTGKFGNIPSDNIFNFDQPWVLR